MYSTLFPYTKLYVGFFCFEYYRHMCRKRSSSFFPFHIAFYSTFYHSRFVSFSRTFLAEKKNEATHPHIVHSGRKQMKISRRNWKRNRFAEAERSKKAAKWKSIIRFCECVVIWMRFATQHTKRTRILSIFEFALIRCLAVFRKSGFSFISFICGGCGFAVTWLCALPVRVANHSC